MTYSSCPAHPTSLSNLFSSQPDLANLVNIAAIKAAVEGADKLTSGQLEFAKDRIIMGTERKTMFVSEDSKKVLISFMTYEAIWDWADHLVHLKLHHLLLTLHLSAHCIS